MTIRYKQQLMFLLLTSVLILVTLPGLSQAQDKSFTGAGSTAIYPVLSKWAEAYYKQTGVRVNYQAIGSGGGIAQIKAGTVAFGATDKPLKPEELKANGLVQYPAVVIGITPVVNISGIKAGELILNGPTLADIYMGKIKKWNDAALRALNPGLNLPDGQITVVHRSDGSGTTFNFADYLSKVSPQWKSKVGADTSVQWPVGVGGKGNAGVAAYVQQVSGSIGYVEYAYATENKMSYARMKNSAGQTVSPSLESFQASAANADFTTVQDFYLILTNQPGEKSWPITGSTWSLQRKDAPKDRNQGVTQFLTYCLTSGKEQARSLDYVPLPENTVTKIKEYWRTQLGI